MSCNGCTIRFKMRPRKCHRCDAIFCSCLDLSRHQANASRDKRLYEERCKVYAAKFLETIKFRMIGHMDKEQVLIKIVQDPKLTLPSPKLKSIVEQFDSSFVGRLKIRRHKQFYLVTVRKTPLRCPVIEQRDPGQPVLGPPDPRLSNVVVTSF